MLSRRHARVKVLQALYAYKLSENHEYHLAEKQLNHSIEKVFDMVYYQMSLLFKIKDVASKTIEEGKNKRVPTAQDLNPNMRFVDNVFLQQLESNAGLQHIFEKRSINWNNDSNIPKNIYKKFRSSALYKSYMADETSSFENDKAIILKLLKKFVYTHRALFDFYEDSSIFWVSDYEYATFILIKILQSLNEHEPGTYSFTNSTDDEIKDVISFSRTLLKKTILKGKNFTEIIALHAQNWEMERIALMDNLIMQMALTELFEFPTIPVKVSLNEYIELSKSYSTPKSNLFINGILDKITEEALADGRIVKKGRGLAG